LFFKAVNQAYVSKFLRGDLFDLSENGRMAICRWYIRYKKIVQSMGKYILFLIKYLFDLLKKEKERTLMIIKENKIYI
jgi:hypothetical protein